MIMKREEEEGKDKGRENFLEHFKGHITLLIIFFF